MTGKRPHDTAVSKQLRIILSEQVRLIRQKNHIGTHRQDTFERNCGVTLLVLQDVASAGSREQ
jgi:hypothetical protein